MRLGEKDFGVFEKEKLIFLNKDVFKKICAIENILAIIFSSFYQYRQDDGNLYFY